MFSDPYFQSELARQRQADIRSAARAARTTRLFRLARRDARRQRRAALAIATPAPVSLPPAAALLQQ